MNITFGVGPNTELISQLLVQVDREIVQQAAEKVGTYVHTEREKLLQGQPGSIVDYYA